MNLEEALAFEAIRKTVIQYQVAGDRIDADGYAACFAEDAVLDAFGPVIEGRAAIRDFIAGIADAFDTNGRKPTFLHHQLTTQSVEMTGPDTARGRCYFTVITDIGPDHHGVYTDKYVRVGGEWLFSKRKIQVDWFAPDSFANRDR
jgi:hypothetical protein